jgi:hypothetical protein
VGLGSDLFFGVSTFLVIGTRPRTSQWKLHPVENSGPSTFPQIASYAHNRDQFSWETGNCDWHEQIGDPTLADGIFDRLVHNAHRIEMKGDAQESPKSELISLRQSSGVRSINASRLVGSCFGTRII